MLQSFLLKREILSLISYLMVCYAYDDHCITLRGNIQRYDKSSFSERGGHSFREMDYGFLNFGNFAYDGRSQPARLCPEKTESDFKSFKAQFPLTSGTAPSVSFGTLNAIIALENMMSEERSRL